MERIPIPMTLFLCFFLLRRHFFFFRSRYFLCHGRLFFLGGKLFLLRFQRRRVRWRGSRFVMVRIPPLTLFLLRLRRQRLLLLWREFFLLQSRLFLHDDGIFFLHHQLIFLQCRFLLLRLRRHRVHW